jgi:hypothetical protein
VPPEEEHAVEESVEPVRGTILLEIGDFNRELHIEDGKLQWEVLIYSLYCVNKLSIYCKSTVDQLSIYRQYTVNILSTHCQ